MFIKDPYSLLAEAASMDLSVNTSVALTESQVNTIMESFDEVNEDVVYTAEMVSVVQVGGDYLVEMNALYPYMQSNKITSVAEALNNVAKVNGLQEKSVGLLIESDDKTKSLIEAAAKKGGKAKEKAMDKIKKATKIPAKLKKEGFPVKKKKSKGSAKDECGDKGCGDSTSVNENKDDDPECKGKCKTSPKKEDALTSDSNAGSASSTPTNTNTDNDEPDGNATESCKKNESSIFNFDLL